MHSPLVAQSCKKHLPFLLMSGSPCCQITPFRVALSMPTCALKSIPKRTRDSDDVAFPNATSTSSRKASYCDSMLGAYTCKIHRDISVNYVCVLLFSLKCRNKVFIYCIYKLNWVTMVANEPSNNIAEL